MLKSYVKTAWRNLVKDKQFSFLNLVGLSTGLACVLFIYLWVSDELTVDKFNTNDTRLYQVLKKKTDENRTIDVGETTQGMLAQSMAGDLPEIEFATLLRKEHEQGMISFDNKRIKATPAF